MKKLFSILLIATALIAKAQPDDITYYEDSRVKNSRFAMALVGNPNFVMRKLINDELGQGGGYDLAGEDSEGSFQFNYNLNLIFSIGDPLDVSLGIGQRFAEFSVENASYYFDTPDTIAVNATTKTSMLTIPFTVNFNTTISDIFDLEVAPSVSVNFIQSYETTLTPVNGEPAFKNPVAEKPQDVIWSVGFSLGGTYKFADNWGVILRPNVRYTLQPLVEQPQYPRENLLSIGAEIGLKYLF